LVFTISGIFVISADSVEFSGSEFVVGDNEITNQSSNHAAHLPFFAKYSSRVLVLGSSLVISARLLCASLLFSCISSG